MMLIDALYALAYLWLFYALYVFTMSVYRAKLSGRLCGLSLVSLYPIVAIAAVMDVLCNYTFACVIFLEPPQELLVTTRLQRHHANNDGWRTTLAAYVCENLLDPFDPTGDHC
jgi:hypothetical protein